MTGSRFLSWDTIMADGKVARKQSHVSENTLYKLLRRLRHTRVHASRIFADFAQGKWRPRLPKSFMLLAHNSTRLFLLEFFLSIFVVSRSSLSEDIPLTNRVRGPFCKLRILVFSSSIYGPSAKRAGHKSKGKKTRIRNLQYGPRKRG